MTKDQKIGFVGIGNMGAPMVRNLARAGWSVVAFDQRPDVVTTLADEHPSITAALNIAEVAGCFNIITMLPTGADVRDVVLGGEGRPGLADAMAQGGLVIDMSSSEPMGTRALGEILKARGLNLIDAPVSGGVSRAVDGTLTIMAGGDEGRIDGLEPMLATMGSVFRTGPLGSGHAMKALNNYLSACGVVAASEAVIIGERFGLDPGVMTEILNASTGRSNATENKLAQQMLNGAFASGFALKLMNKDVAMARDLAAALGVPAATLDHVSSTLGEALDALGDTADHTELYRYIEGLGKKSNERRDNA
jgi:3-hydroxyisobutyrate dehydrogenase